MEERDGGVEGVITADVVPPSFSPSGNSLVDNDGALVAMHQWQDHGVHTNAVKVTMMSANPGAQIQVHDLRRGSGVPIRRFLTWRFRLQPLLLQLGPAVVPEILEEGDEPDALSACERRLFTPRAANRRATSRPASSSCSRG